jgi:hypothetical protein
MENHRQKGDREHTDRWRNKETHDVASDTFEDAVSDFIRQSTSYGTSLVVPFVFLHFISHYFIVDVPGCSPNNVPEMH